MASSERPRGTVAARAMCARRPRPSVDQRRDRGGPRRTGGAMKPTPRTVHHLALVGAAGMSGIALFDAGTKALTGHLSVFSDDSDVEWLLQVSNVGARTGLRGDGGRPGRCTGGSSSRSTGWPGELSGLLRGSHDGVWPLGFLVLTPSWIRSDLPAALGAVVGVAFMVMLLAAPVLGIAVRRTPELRPGSLLLVAMIPILGSTDPDRGRRRQRSDTLRTWRPRWPSGSPCWGTGLQATGLPRPMPQPVGQRSDQRGVSAERRRS